MKPNFYKSFRTFDIEIFLFFICSFGPSISRAQSHQDCMDAIIVCSNTYLQTSSSAGYGNTLEIPAGTTCIANGETNSTWYIFSIQNPGTLLFQIDPLNIQDDYDFVLYKYTGNCSDIINGTIQPIRCNYSSTNGSTGLAQGYTGTNIASNGSNQCAPLPVLQNERYIMMVNNFTATNSGYALNFGGSASIYDTDPPSLTTTNITSCGPQVAYLYFSESIKCSSIAPDGSDFKITGPSNVSITAATPLSNNYTVLTPGIKIYFNTPIIVPGNYTLQVKKGVDGNTLSDYCDNMISWGSQIHFDILYSSPVAAITSFTNSVCNNNNGTATGSVNGGNPPYSYSWNSTPSQFNLTATNLSSGQYTFTVTDANGCTGHANVNIASEGIPHLTVNTLPETCDSLNFGSATVLVSGGVSPFTYSWNTAPVQTTSTATGLSSGSYTVIVTGANGCTASITAFVPLVGMPVITMAHTNITCNNSGLGSATASVSGHAPFTYLWSDGSTTSFISGLIQGTYTLTVTDAGGCFSTATVPIDKGGMQLSVSTVNLECGNVPNGTATVSSLQGNPPLTYLWNTTPQQISATAVNLEAGSWVVTVTDSSGCRDSITAIITGPPPLIVNVTTTSAGCTLHDGSATVSISGGNDPYTYLWNTNPVQTSDSASDLPAGAYQVTISDSDNCITTATAYISNWDGPSGFISDVVDATCNLPNGSASINNVTGNGPFSYLWYTSPLQYSSTANALGAGIYTVKITDHEGCLSFLNVKINTTGNPELSVDYVVNASCGFDDGKASLAVASGGVAPFLYEWNTTPPQFTQTAAGIGAGTYLTVVTDAKGCKDSLTVTIPENKAHNDFAITTSCINEPAFFSGITDYPGMVSWKWNFGDASSGQDNTATEQNASHIFSSSNSYFITLYLNGGCATDTLTKYVSESVKPNASFTYSHDKLFATAPVNFTYTGSPASELLWDFGDGNSSYEINPFHIYKFTNAYEVTLYVSDEFGCKDTINAAIDIDFAPAIFVPGGFTPNNDGINDHLTIPSHGLQSCDFKIFDRWGSMVFHSENPAFMNDNGWDGYFHNIKLPEGAYAYILNGRLENGKPVVKEGFINLLR
ncbi:MAG: gliding motility-associated C-terminal domain-containing protein [Bacteroidia bacterium]